MCAAHITEVCCIMVLLSFACFLPDIEVCPCPFSLIFVLSCYSPGETLPGSVTSYSAQYC